MHYRRWGISIENLTYFLFLRAVVNIPIQTSIISPWLIFRKMIISQLELGIFIGNLTVCFITDLIISQLELGIFIGNLTVFFITERGRKYSHTNSHDFTMALYLARWWSHSWSLGHGGLLCLSLSPQGAWRRFACSPAVRFLCSIQERDQVLQRAYWPHYTVIFGMIWSYSIETKPFLNDSGEQISIVLLLKPLGHESLSKKSTDNWSTINAIHLCWGDIRNSHFSNEHGSRSKPCKASTQRTVHFDFPF